MYTNIIQTHSVKKLLIALLLASLCASTVFAEESSENSIIFRFNWLYVDEVFDVDVNNEGNGATVELAFVIEETENKFMSIGYEIGYLKAENGGSELGVTADLNGAIDLGGIQFGGITNPEGINTALVFSRIRDTRDGRELFDEFTGEPAFVRDGQDNLVLEPTAVRLGVSRVDLDDTTIELENENVRAIDRPNDLALQIEDEGGGITEVEDTTQEASFTDTPIQLSEIDVDMIPIFVNYTIGGVHEDSRTYWDVGAGFGVIIAEVDIGLQGFPTMNDDDLVFGGQIFGSVGYEITEAVNLFFGMRYMIAEDFDFQDSVEISEGLTLDADFQLDKAFNSIAYEIGLNIFF